MSAYYKNSEIAKKFGVSNPTVGYWIKGAMEKKNNLILEFLPDDKVVISHSQFNEAEIERLIKEGRKHAPKAQTKVVEVSDELYQNLTKEQLVELYYGLVNNREISIKYNYFYQGVADAIGDKYILKNSDLSNFVIDSIQTTCMDCELYTRASKINIVDIGVGSGHPMLVVIDHFKSKNIFERYFGLDISDKIIETAKKNLLPAFGNDSLSFEKFDFENQDLRARLLGFEKTEGSKNLVFLIGHVLQNFTERAQNLRKIAQSLAEGDLFVFTALLNSQQAKAKLDYMKYAPQKEVDFAYAFRLIGIDVEKCQVKIFYNEKDNYKYKTYILDKNYSIKFMIDGKVYLLELRKGEELIRWRHYLYEFDDLMLELKYAGLEVMSYKTDITKSNALLVCRRK